MRQISEELDDSRLECVRSVRRVENNLGIATDPNEKFQESLEEKLADTVLAKADKVIMRKGQEMGIHV